MRMDAPNSVRAISCAPAIRMVGKIPASSAASSASFSPASLSPGPAGRTAGALLTGPAGHRVKGKGVALKATEQPVDTGTAAGKAFLDMLGVFAEFETNLRRERQLEGISAAKARGVYKGRKPSIDAGEVLRLRHDEKLGPAAIARRLGIGRASVYRLLGKEAGRTNGTPDADQA